MNDVQTYIQDYDRPAGHRPTGGQVVKLGSELTSKAAGNAFGGQSERITSNSCPGVFSSGIFDKCLPLDRHRCIRKASA
jgi:hypothetical protein